MSKKKIAKDILCTFSENIRNARRERGYTQSTLASLMEVDPISIYNYEAGICIPTFPNLVKLIDALEVTPNDILCEKRELTPQELLMFDVQLPRKPLPKRKKRIRFKVGEEPDFANEMKDLILKNKRMKEASRKKRAKRRHKEDNDT